MQQKQHNSKKENSCITWISEVEIHNGKKNELIKLCKKTWERVTISEPDTIMYEFYVQEGNNSNNDIMWVYHRFSNSQAAITHIEDAGEEFAKMQEFMDFKCMRLLGPADDKLMEILKNFNPVIFNYVGGVQPDLENRSI